MFRLDAYLVLLCLVFFFPHLKKNLLEDCSFQNGNWRAVNLGKRSGSEVKEKGREWSCSQKNKLIEEEEEDDEDDIDMDMDDDDFFGVDELADDEEE